MRLQLLHQAGLAEFIQSGQKQLSRRADHFIARLENRLIKFLLLNRIKPAFSAQTDPDAIAKLLGRYRAAYNSGKLSTLAMTSNLERHLVPALGAPTDASWTVTPGQRPIILYTAGGGFILPPSNRQIGSAMRLGKLANCDCLMNLHSMAPENPFPCAIDDTLSLYRWLREKHPAENIVLAADTAGASVTLGAALSLRDSGEPMPAGILLFSPWADLSLSGWSYITKSASSDSPFRMETAAFCAKVYLQNTPANEPLASAIYADLKEFPPLSIHTSRFDMHFDDALRIVENANKTGVDAQLKYWESPRHHLERFNNSEAEKSLAIAADFVRARLSQAAG
jgi:acetyl esterase/lipase